MGRWLVALVALSVLGACAHGARVPLLAVGPMRVGDPTLFDDAALAAQNAGHPPVHRDAEHGSFVVRANEDPSRATIFTVQCSLDGYVTVTPEGAGITRTGDSFEMPAELRHEYADFVFALEQSIPESR